MGRIVNRRFIGLLLALSLVALTHGCAKPSIIRLSDGAETDLGELVAMMRASRIVFVSEAHSVKRYHEVQLLLIKALKDSGADITIGMEMFKAGEQDSLDAWVEGKLPEADFRKVYEKNWHVPWEQYADILVYAKTNRIPLVGLNISRDVVRQVFRSGFKSLTPEQLKTLPGIRCEVSPAYEDFITRSMGRHETSEAAFTNYCEAQMVWDTTMAWNAVEYLKGRPEKTLVVMAGGGHSWRHGIPEQVGRLSSAPYLIILLELSEEMLHENFSLDDGDYLWME